VTELPEAEAFRQMRVRRKQVRLIPLSTTTIRSALRGRSAIRDLDMLVQQERSEADLYDIRAPVIDRLDFFGRQDTIDSLKGELREGRSVDVWGLPGIGNWSTRSWPTPTWNTAGRKRFCSTSRSSPT
jgi:hypothetical protein